MTFTKAIELAADTTSRTPELPGHFLNCYEISDSSKLAWAVHIYVVDRIDSQKQTHNDRGEIKNIVWKPRKQFAGRCRGVGYVIDLGERTVAVPATWDLPSPIEVDGYRVTRECTVTTSTSEPRDRPIILGIIREAVKGYFKSNNSEALGPLWQDYNAFCQMPSQAQDAEYLLCRRFSLVPKVLRNNRWVLEFVVSTVTLDAKTFADYYRQGKVDVLADMIEAKRANRLTRQNRPTAIRVWRNETTDYQSKAVILELADPSTVIGHESLSHHVQSSLAAGTIRCQSFNGPQTDIPFDQIRLVLDTQITQDEHAETIIEPGERERLMRHLRDFIDEADIYGHSLRLAETPFDLNELPTFEVVPPSIRMKSMGGSEIILPAPSIMSDESLRKRARDRAEHLRQHGFLQQRPINPLLAWPDRLGEKRARRMKADLEYIWKQQGIDFTFGLFLYSEVEHLRREIERSGYDALFAVLPEGWRAPHRLDDTHEKIKQRIQIPSQCIKHDHTLPETWVDKKPREFRDAHPELARRIRQQYELCLGNLLVKHHWIPFAPADPFYYNTHVGFDVGGRHNNQAMACLGHGFQKPRDGLIFRPEEIPIDVQKAEPIPTECLYRGLLQLFEFVHSELTAAGSQSDFARTLFYRDGLLLGDGDAWNERDVLVQLHAELLKRGWVPEDSMWTAVEVLKRAEEWRVLRNQGRVTNPFIGQCIFPFDDENMVLLSTTGAPYLSQGTACPLLIRIVNIYGCAERSEVIRDLVWQADMCFTKPDTSLRLPWVLHVADTGALQTSRSYRISGLTV